MAIRCSAIPKPTSVPTVLAHHLHAQGIGKGDVVALFVENRPELLLNVLAVAKLGGICAMLNTAQTQAALVHSLNLVSPVAIIVGAELVGLL